MNRLDELIAELCPDGVEYRSIGSLIMQIRERAKNNLDIKQVYAVSNSFGMVKAEEFREHTIHSNDLSNYSVIRPNMFAYNPSRLNIGSIAMLKDNIAGLVSPMYVVFSIDESVLRKEYFEYYLSSSYVKNKIDSLKEEGARFRFDFARWDSIYIPLPPLIIQDEIVRILDTFTKLTAELTAELTARKKQYEYYRDELLTFGDDVQTVQLAKCTENISKIKWEEAENLYEYIDLSSVDREMHSIITTTTINKDSAPSRAQQIIETDDVLFGSTRPMLKRSCLVSEQHNQQVCSTGFCVLRANKSIILPKWIYFNINTTDFYNHVEMYQKGASYPAISNADIKKYEIPLPSLEEQQRIVDILDRFDALCNDISIGLPAEIDARQKQYEYYRDKLLTFKEI